MTLSKTVIETSDHVDLVRQAQEIRNQRGESTMSIDIRVSQESPLEVHTHDSFWSNVMYFEASSEYPSDETPAEQLVTYLRSLSIVPRANIALEGDELQLQAEAGTFLMEVANALESSGRHVTAALLDADENPLIEITASVFNSKICPFQKNLKDLLKEHVPEQTLAAGNDMYELTLTLTADSFAFPENNGKEVSFLFHEMHGATMDTSFALGLYEILCDGDFDVVSLDSNDDKETIFYKDLEKVCLTVLEMLGNHNPIDLEVDGELVRLNVGLL